MGCAAVTPTYGRLKTRVDMRPAVFSRPNRLRQDPRIGDGVAVDDEQIGDLAGLDGAQIGTPQRAPSRWWPPRGPPGR